MARCTEGFGGNFGVLPSCLCRCGGVRNLLVREKLFMFDRCARAKRRRKIFFCINNLYLAGGCMRKVIFFFV